MPPEPSRTLTVNCDPGETDFVVRQVRPVGSTKNVEVDVRLVSATHRDLHALIAAGRFREDLYHRLATFPIALPPLRERRADIPALIEALGDDAALRNGTALPEFDPDAVALLGAQTWRGNIRELRNVLEQATLANPGNKQLLAAYGRSLNDNGNFQKAFDILSRAHTPDNPDWRILSVQGTALDQMGKHAEARGYYASALRMAPDEPSVLSNLGMSYVLSRDLPKAEETLRRAQATGRADDLAQPLALHHALAQAKAGEDGAVANGQVCAAVADVQRAVLVKPIELVFAVIDARIKRIAQ